MWTGMLKKKKLRVMEKVLFDFLLFIGNNIDGILH